MLLVYLRISKVIYVPGDTGFLPSTVFCKRFCVFFFTCLYTCLTFWVWPRFSEPWLTWLFRPFLVAKNWRVPSGVVEFSFLSNLESKPERTMNRLVPSLKEDGQESIFWLSFCYSLSVKCIDSSLKESSVMRSDIADQTMRMCQRLNDLTPKMVQYLFWTCYEVMCYIRQ